MSHENIQSTIFITGVNYQEVSVIKIGLPALLLWLFALLTWETIAKAPQPDP